MRQVILLLIFLGLPVFSPAGTVDVSSGDEPESADALQFVRTIMDRLGARPIECAEWVTPLTPRGESHLCVELDPQVNEWTWSRAEWEHRGNFPGIAGGIGHGTRDEGGTIPNVLEQQRSSIVWSESVSVTVYRGLRDGESIAVAVWHGTDPPPEP